MSLNLFVLQMCLSKELKLNILSKREKSESVGVVLVQKMQEERRKRKKYSFLLKINKRQEIIAPCYLKKKERQ
jgi:hypothetical protein